MVLSMAGFSINDAFIKSLDGAVPSTQVMAVRGLILSVLISLLLWQRGIHRRLGEAVTPLVGLRASMELLATYFFLSALSLLTLASISAILQVLPLAVTLGAALFFREPVGWRRWLAILVGFTGVMIIIRPGTAGFEPASLLVVLSVLFAAGRDLATRALPAAIPSLIVTAATAVLVTVTGFALTVMDVYKRQALGYLVFAEVPDQWTLVGSTIVIAMGLFTLYREVVRSRQVVAATSNSRL